jgi:hypothetical protein
MSYFYFNAKILNKATQSAVAKAAYTSNEAYYSERDEETKKYKTRTVKPESFILAPNHAPDFVYNREKLWNEVEKVEKQYNAQLLRELVVALPSELNEEAQTSLVREFVQENLVSEGMVADIHIHRDQEHNPHAHILLTLRPFNEDGTWWDFKSKKEYLLDENGENLLDKNGKKRTRKVDLTGWNSKDNLLGWRKSFAEKINEYYLINGIDKSVSHESYEKQGIDKLPSQRLTRSEYYVEKMAKKEAEKNGVEYEPVTFYGKKNKEISDYNNEIESLQNEIRELEEIENNSIEINANDFNEIRNNFKLSNDEYDALQFVKSRQKVVYVNFSDSKSALDSISYWKGSIDKKHRSLNREEQMLKTVKDMYEKGNVKLERYGFSMEGFVSDYNSRMDSLNSKYASLTSEVKKYKDAFTKTKITNDIQKNILDNEFKFLYPKYSDITKIDTDEINDIKNKYVNEFKQNNVILDSISEIDTHEHFATNEEQYFRDNVWNLVLDYRNQSKQHFSLNKSLDAKEKDYLAVINDKDGKYSTEEIYNSALDYLVTKNEKNVLETNYQNTKEKMLNTLVEIYGEQQRETLEQMPDRVKNMLLENYLKDKEMNTLSEDLEKINWKIRQKNVQPKGNDFEEYIPSNSTGANVGNILTSLVENAKQNENKDNTPRKKRLRGKKLTKEEIIEMEK